MLQTECLLEKDYLPKIMTIYDLSHDNSNSTFYHEAVVNILKKVLPSRQFTQDKEGKIPSELLKRFHQLLPILKFTPCESVPANMSFYVLSKYRTNAFKFFFDMLVNWLVPGKRLNVVMLYAADFCMPDLSPTVYTVCEMIIHIENQADLEQIQSNLPIIQSEVRLGMESSYYARRILEIKGLSGDAKAAMIQENIAYLISRRPKDFDYDVLTEMQHVMVMCRDDFKVVRECRHMSRIISTHYLFRKALRESVKKFPEKRHLSLKIFRANLHLPTGNKAVLGVLVGLNFLRDKEVFEKRHLLNAIQNFIPLVKAVEHSFFSNRRGNENICTLYLELEKSDGQNFTAEEIRTLRRELPSDLKDRIEHLMHPVFMPRNEEEIMRNILSLSNQIKYLRDIPQVFISFDEQTHSNLFFTVILVRVMRHDTHSIQELFKSSHSCLEYLHDRCKIVGFLRKKYTKEATVFRVKLPKEHYLRNDHSLNLYKARQTVVLELLRIVGDFRDFNGGMISKQNELLCALKEQLDGKYKYTELLLENFFYSLTPVIMRTLLDPEVLKTLFVMMLDAMDKDFFTDVGYFLKISTNCSFVFIMIKTEQRTIKDDINRVLNKQFFHSSELANSYVKACNIHHLGYVYRCDDSLKQMQFIQIIQNTLANNELKTREK